MNTFKQKYNGVSFILLLLLVITGGSELIVAKADEASQGREVRTDLQQQMQKKISVDFKDMDIDNALIMMTKQAGVNYVKSPKVTGNVTATLTDVPLEEVLNTILKAHGYGYELSDNIIRVAPLEEIINTSIERLVSRIYRITYADVVEVERALKKFISKRGTITSNAGTSNIIVNDIESRIKAIDEFVKEIDRITPQILVEARIYDITSKNRLDLGVQWSAGRNSSYYSDAAGTTATTEITGVGINPSGKNHPFMSGAFSGVTNKASSTTGALRLGWLNNSIDIDVLLKAQKEVISAKLLANPRVLVLDNKTASINIISEIPYQEISETSGGGSIGSTSFRNVGVELQVTPHLTRDNMVRLHLVPKFSVKAGTVVVGSGQASAAYEQPIVDKREADTTLLIKSGQTVVLGGLRKKEVTKQINKVPLLGDVPLLGNLFKFEGEDTVNSELVVFVTPYIITEPVLTDAENKQLEETKFESPKVEYTRAEKSADKEK